MTYLIDKTKTRMIKVNQTNSYIMVTVRIASAGKEGTMWDKTDVSYFTYHLTPDELRSQVAEFKQSMLAATEIEFIRHCEKYVEFSTQLRRNIEKKQS